MRKIRKGDDVIVITGKGRHENQRGVVLQVLDDDRLLVEGVKLVKRHTRANPQLGTAGGIVEKESPIHVSNVALYNPATKKGDRIGIKILQDGKKVRCFKSTGEVVDV